RVRKFNTGMVIQQENTEQCIAAIEELCKVDRQEQKQRFDEYFQQHSTSRLPQVLRDLLQKI
ncbi:MAG: hypothetical protein ACK424_02000, partial [Candidatus Thermochlorobacter sp.]